MQYPVPAQPVRSVVIKKSNPRFAHLPLVKGLPDGTIEVVRGDASVAERLAADPQSAALFEPQRVGRVWFVVQNRLGDLWFGPVGRQTLAGLMENMLYTAPAGMPEAVTEAKTAAELRSALVDEVEWLDVLVENGWELAAHPRGGQVWVDTRRPDEDLTPDDLP